MSCFGNCASYEHWIFDIFLCFISHFICVAPYRVSRSTVFFFWWFSFLLQTSQTLVGKHFISHPHKLAIGCLCWTVLMKLICLLFCVLAAATMLILCIYRYLIMGRIFLAHLGGTRLFSCASCDTPLTNRSELISTRFTGATGRAFLFNRVVNLNYSEVQDRVMLTGRHMVRDVACKNCDAKLGWIYEFATEESQRYKEGRVILERALVTESDGFEEHIGPDNWGCAVAGLELRQGMWWDRPGRGKLWWAVVMDGVITRWIWGISICLLPVSVHTM